jgi:hypothetical protein
MMNEREQEIFIKGIAVGIKAGQEIENYLQEDIRQERRIKKEKRIYTPKKRRKFIGQLVGWTNEEDDFIRKNRDKTVKELHELMPNRTISALTTRRAKIGANRIFKEKNNDGKSIEEMMEEENLANLGQKI